MSVLFDKLRRCVIRLVVWFLSYDTWWSCVWCFGPWTDIWRITEVPWHMEEVGGLPSTNALRLRGSSSQLYYKKWKYTPAVRSKISSKLILASCVWYSDRAHYELCVLIKDIGTAIYDGQGAEAPRRLGNQPPPCLPSIIYPSVYSLFGCRVPTARILDKIIRVLQQPRGAWFSFSNNTNNRV